MDEPTRVWRRRRPPGRAVLLGVLLGAAAVGVLVIVGGSLAPRPAGQPPAAATSAPAPTAEALAPAAAPTLGAPTVEPAVLPAAPPTLLPTPLAPLGQPKAALPPHPPARPAPSPAVDAAEQVRAAMRDLVPAGSAVYWPLDVGAPVRYGGALSLPAASTIKLPLLLEVLRQAETGRLDLQERHTLAAAEITGGTGVLQQSAGRTLTLGELARLMILHSDNTAANILLDRVGMAAVNATTLRLDLQQTRFQRRFLDQAARARGLENTTSADDMAALLAELWARRAVSPAASQRALELLRARGERDPDWLKLRLPRDTVLYHLNGTLDGVRNDAGIVEPAPGRAYVLVVLQAGLRSEAAGEQAIARLSERIFRLAGDTP